MTNYLFNYVLTGRLYITVTKYYIQLSFRQLSGNIPASYSEHTWWYSGALVLWNPGAAFTQ